MNVKTWTNKFLQDQAEASDKENKVEVLLDLCDQNNIDVAKLRSQLDNSTAGRIRMTAGNLLRGAAVRRLGLFDLEGDWNEVPAEVVEANALTARETPQGEKIRKARRSAEDAAEQNASA